MVVAARVAPSMAPFQEARLMAHGEIVGQEASTLSWRAAASDGMAIGEDQINGAPRAAVSLSPRDADSLGTGI